MGITASDVKKLREMTGAGMMACKQALNETGGNIDEAMTFLRKKGLAAAEKKQSRVAAEGVIATLVEGNEAVAVEVNCETDFVSKGEDFQNFAQSIANFALKEKPQTTTELKEAKKEAVNELTLKCGEKVDIRRFQSLSLSGEGIIGQYNHGGKIGVLIKLESDKNLSGNDQAEDFVKDLCMHIAAAAPQFLTADQIDEDFKKKEADLYTEQLKDQGKPENIIPKIVEGKLAKMATEICLMNQKFVKDPDLTIEKLIAQKSKELDAKLKITDFFKLNLGEGIEKKEDNLAEEVAKMSGKQ